MIDPEDEETRAAIAEGLLQARQGKFASEKRVKAVWKKFGVTDVHRLDDEERRLLREGIADLNAGRIVSDADMEAFWRRRRRR